jgi:drug/metabolite transporter (DMT)-like permease
MVLHARSPGQVSLSPLVLAASRFALAGLCFAVPVGLAVARRRIARRDLLRLAVLGQTSYSLYFWLQYVGVQKTSAGVSAILVVGLAPLATALVARWAGQEEFSASRLGALALGFAGVLLIGLQTGRATLGLDPDYLLGSLALLATAFAWAVNSVLGKRWMQDGRLSPLVLTGGTMISGAAGLIALSAAAPEPARWHDLLRLSAAQWAAVAFLAFVCSVGGYYLYNFALTKVEASRAAAYGFFEPVVAVLLGTVLLGEHLRPPALLGGVLIVLSAAGVGRSPAAERPGARAARPLAGRGP